MPDQPDAALALIEPVPIDDDLCSGLALVEEAGVGARMVFFARQRVYESGGYARVVKAKVVVPVEELPALIEMAARHLLACARRPAPDATLRVVR